MYAAPLLLNILCIMITVLVVVTDNQKKRLPIFSLRNFFLAGFLYFQSFGFFSWILNRPANGWWALVVEDKNYTTSISYGLYLNLFLVVFLITFGTAKFNFKAFTKCPPPTPDRLVRLSLFVLAIGLLVFLLGKIALPDLMRYASDGICAAATGFAAWAWSSKLKRPYFWSILILVAAASLLPHLTAYGRRGIVSIAAIIAWVVYYRVTFRFSFTKLVIVTALVVSPMIVIVAAFSEVRVHRPQTAGEAVQAMMKADIGRGMARLATFQGSAPISLWCMENFPRPYNQRHLYSLKATGWFFLPRAAWPDKPAGLGIQIPRMAGMRRVGGLNVGAGLIGHSMAEGGLYAIVIYALILGVGFKFFDSLILQKSSVYYTVPLAASLGNVFATCRGELNYFIDLTVISLFSAFVVTFVLGRLFFGFRRIS